MFQLSPRIEINRLSRQPITTFGLLTLLVCLLWWPDLARAQSPDDGQPDFTVSIESSPDGATTIYSQEAVLDGAYFAANGTLTGAVATPTGLALAEGVESGLYESGVIASPLAFTTDAVPLWRVNLPEGSDLLLETRLQTTTGDWSDWLENPEAFYPVRDDEHSGALIWVGQEQAALQFRLTLRRGENGLSPTVERVTLVFNDTSNGPTDNELAAATQEEEEEAAGLCLFTKPPVVPRTTWGCPPGANSPRRPPTYRSVTHIVIHHAVTPNYTAPYSNWAGWVRSVWNYHANVLRWGDVGYNYLIDPNGVIYEGRAGGDDVIGMHDGYNAGSMGIGFLGCYGDCGNPHLDVAHPTQAMLDSATKLMAWKLAQKRIDPYSSGPYANRPHVPVIAGGCDVSQTISPGRNLYDKLPFWRETIKARFERCFPPPPPPPPPLIQACRIQQIIFDQAEYTAGTPINLTAKLVDYAGNPLGGGKLSFNVEVAAVRDTGAWDYPMADRTGDYDGTYINTWIPGNYLFKIFAKDPTGKRFAPCSAEAEVTVKGNTLPTPTPTPTLTPTPAPTFTPTPTSTPPPPTRQCQIQVRPDPATQTLGGPVRLIAEATLNGRPLTAASVTGAVIHNGLSQAVSLPHQGAGVYQMNYTNTTSPGSYTFALTAQGNGFVQCSAQSSFTIRSGGVIITDTTVTFAPSPLRLTPCKNGQTTHVKAINAKELFAFSLRFEYDPAVARVVDADPQQPGTQVRIGRDFSSRQHFIARNVVNQTDGIIEFDATLFGANTLDGDITLIEVDWAPVASGRTTLAFTPDKILLMTPATVVIRPKLVNGQIEVGACTLPPGSRRVELQGRQNHSGVRVTNAAGEQTQSNADGSFTLADDGPLTLTYPGYLSARLNPPENPSKVILLAGDINNDNKINILDLAYIASQYRATDAKADLNGSGEVDLIDLTLAARNYNQQGPLTAWQ